ncbi:MAG: DUF1016 N-terminal domain-containing protein [Roseburia sp.]|nr:DUF1016 N-terminal domain-containing protein [Roseburia sp.]
MRQFYMTYKNRENEIIQLQIGQLGQEIGIVQSGIGQLLDITYSQIPFKLSWTHYQILMRIEDKDEREFYEKEAMRSAWNVSTLKRQYHSSLYERHALSRNKDDVLRLANEGAIQDLGQMQMYVNYYERYERIEGENPTSAFCFVKRAMRHW